MLLWIDSEFMPEMRKAAKDWVTQDLMRELNKSENEFRKLCVMAPRCKVKAKHPHRPVKPGPVPKPPKTPPPLHVIVSRKAVQKLKVTLLEKLREAWLPSTESMRGLQ